MHLISYFYSVLLHLLYFYLNFYIFNATQDVSKVGKWFYWPYLSSTVENATYTFRTSTKYLISNIYCPPVKYIYNV